MNISLRPEEWLSESALSPQGKEMRRTYTAYLDTLYATGAQAYKVARSVGMLQEMHYRMLPEGFALPPHTINLCVNNSCNLKCVYCDLNRGLKKGEARNALVRDSMVDLGKKIEFSFDALRGILDAVAWFRPTIRVPRMEPLLYSHILDLAHYAKGHGMPFSMLTNGLLLKKKAADLVRAKVDAIRISLDGPEDVHDKLCAVPGAYALIMEGLRTLVEECRRAGHHMQIGCDFTLTDGNSHLMVEHVEGIEKYGLLHDVFINFHMFNFISRPMMERHNREHADLCGAQAEETSTALVDLSRIDIDAVLAQRDTLRARYARKGVRLHFRPDFSRENLRFALSEAALPPPGVRCTAPWHTLFVMPNGVAKHVPLCMLPGYGNILQESFMDVWNGVTARRHRRLLQEHGAFHACMRCTPVYNAVEAMQHTWQDASAPGIATDV